MDVGVSCNPILCCPLYSKSQFCSTWPHSLLAHRLLHYLQWGVRDNTSTSAAPSRVALARPPSYRPSPKINMSTSDDAGYSDRLRCSTRANQEAVGGRRERSTSLDSRRGRPPEENTDDNSDTSTCGHAQCTPTDRVDLPVHEEEVEKPLPGLGTSRRQVLPVAGGRHHLTSPHSTEHHRHHLDSPRSTERLLRNSRDRAPMSAPRTPRLNLLWPSEHFTMQT